MHKKFLFTIVALSAMCVSSLSYAASTAKTATAVTTTKPASKSVTSEDEKYAQVYEKCTKEAGVNEAKYDQLFNACMEKNGFPQEEYETGKQPAGAADGQDN